MAENKKSGVSPAQARLLKLKKNLKGLQEMCEPKPNQNSPKAESSKSTSAEEKLRNRVRKSLLEASKLKKQADSKSVSYDVKPTVSKPSPSKKSVKEEDLVALKLKKKLRDQGKICKCKEGSKKSKKNKKESSSSSDVSPSKSHSLPDNAISPPSSSSIRDKIRNLIQKVTSFPVKNQDKTAPKQKKSDEILKQINTAKKRIFTEKPINSSENSQKNKSSHQINRVTPGKSQSSLETTKKSEKTAQKPLITETGKRNLFKRQRLPSPPKEVTKLFDLERVLPEGKVDGSLCDDGLKLKGPINFKIKKRKTTENTENIITHLRSPLEQSHSAEVIDFNKSKIPQQSNHVKKERCFNDSETNSTLDPDQTMEWEPNNEEILRCTRNETNGCENEEMMDYQDGISEMSINPKDGKCIYFVVDTNVLIQSLYLIKKLIMIELRGFPVIIMIPWQVLKELDKLKSIGNESVAYCARRASKFLSESQNEGCNVIFQKQIKHFEDCHQVLVEVPDDQLIKCCCQLKNENKKVILLSNDTNLRVKASATGGFPAVPDSWITNILQKKTNSSKLHCFENEPTALLSSAERICAQFIYRLTKCFSSFLFVVIRECLRRKYDELWVLWTPNIAMCLEEILSFAKSLTILEPFEKQITDIWKFYQEKSLYNSINAMDIEKHGRNCILLAKSIHHLFPEIVSQYDKDMGFLKTGDIGESFYSYTSASSMVAQTYFKRMEDKLNSSLNHLSQLVSKIFSQRIVIPDTKDLLNNINRNIIVTNEASTVFLLMDKDEELPLDTPEVVLFHKILLNFLDEKVDEYSLPLFTPEDIVMYINQERSHLNPAALHWLSDVRRQFMEYKSVLREH